MWRSTLRYFPSANLRRGVIVQRCIHPSAEKVVLRAFGTNCHDNCGRRARCLSIRTRPKSIRTERDEGARAREDTERKERTANAPRMHFQSLYPHKLHATARPRCGHTRAEPKSFRCTQEFAASAHASAFSARYARRGAIANGLRSDNRNCLRHPEYGNYADHPRLVARTQWMREEIWEIARSMSHFVSRRTSNQRSNLFPHYNLCVIGGSPRVSRCRRKITQGYYTQDAPFACLSNAIKSRAWSCDASKDRMNRELPWRTPLSVPIVN